VAVEKLTHQKMTERTLRQDALQTAFSIPVDIFYPQNFSCFEYKGLFQQPRLLTTVTSEQPVIQRDLDMHLQPCVGYSSPVEVSAVT
jgi:hypothetical protein